jgi:hypothetical protein
MHTSGKGDIQEEIRIREQIVKKRNWPTEQELWALADAYMRKGDIDKEIAIRKQTVERYPSSEVLADRLADAY